MDRRWTIALCFPLDMPSTSTCCHTGQLCAVDDKHWLQQPNVTQIGTDIKLLYVQPLGLLQCHNLISTNQHDKGMHNLT